MEMNKDVVSSMPFFMLKSTVPSNKQLISYDNNTTNNNDNNDDNNDNDNYSGAILAIQFIYIYILITLNICCIYKSL